MTSGEDTGTRNLNNIDFPQFNQSHLRFFQQAIEICRQERLNLEPREADFHFYQLQWNSLIAKEQEYQWLIDASSAVTVASREDRVHGSGYDPEQLLAGINDNSGGVDLNNLVF